MSDETHSFVCHDSFVCLTLLIHTCDMTHRYVWHDSFICATWFIHMCDMTHSYVWHDSSICVTWLIQTCDMIHSYVWHDSFICVTWLIDMCDMTHSYVRHDCPPLFPLSLPFTTLFLPLSHALVTPFPSLLRWAGLHSGWILLGRRFWEPAGRVAHRHHRFCIFFFPFSFFLAFSESF